MSKSEVMEKKSGRGRPKMTEEQKRAAREERARKKAEVEGDPFVAAPAPKRPYVRSGVVVDHGVPCFHCRHRFDHKKSHKYANGVQRYICAKCKRPFVVKKEDVVL